MSQLQVSFRFRIIRRFYLISVYKFVLYQYLNYDPNTKESLFLKIKQYEI